MLSCMIPCIPPALAGPWCRKECKINEPEGKTARGGTDKCFPHFIQSFFIDSLATLEETHKRNTVPHEYAQKWLLAHSTSVPLILSEQTSFNRRGGGGAHQSLAELAKLSRELFQPFQAEDSDI